VVILVVVVVVVVVMVVVLVVVAKFLSADPITRIYLQENSPERCLRALLCRHNWNMYSILYRNKAYNYE